MEKSKITFLDNCNPAYDIHQYLDKLAAEFGDRFNPQKFLLMDCPGCGHVTYYNGTIVDVCNCCGFYNIADWSFRAYTVEEYWNSGYLIQAGYDVVENFNLSRE